MATPLDHGDNPGSGKQGKPCPARGRRACHHELVAGTGSRGVRGLVPLLVVSGVVVLVAFGQARGLWLSNLHNGLLALAFAFVGAYVLFQRPGHREGVLFLATGVVEAVMFFGRQIGHCADVGRQPVVGMAGGVAVGHRAGADDTFGALLSRWPAALGRAGGGWPRSWS